MNYLEITSRYGPRLRVGYEGTERLIAWLETHGTFKHVHHLLIEMTQVFSRRKASAQKPGLVPKQ